MITINEETYKKIAALILEHIGDADFFNGTIEYDTDEFYSFVKSENEAPMGNKLRFSDQTPSFVHRPEKKSYLWLRNPMWNQCSLRLENYLRCVGRRVVRHRLPTQKGNG